MHLINPTDNNSIVENESEWIENSSWCYCTSCGSYLEVWDLSMRCSVCGNKFKVCPSCGSPLNEDEGEYTCSNLKCGHIFSLRPKCNSTAAVYGSTNGMRQYKCLNRGCHGGKFYRFTPKMSHREDRRRKARHLAIKLKEYDDKLTAREISKKLSDLSFIGENCSLGLSYPASTVSRWVKGKNSRKTKLTLIERINSAKQTMVDLEFFRCRAIRALEPYALR